MLYDYFKANSNAVQTSNVTNNILKNPMLRLHLVIILFNVYYELLFLGKRISVTLLDFGIWSRQHDTSTVFCDQYATLVEQSTGEQFHVCGGHEREEHIYTSKTSSLEVSMLSATTTGASKYFILKYKSKISNT